MNVSARFLCNAVIPNTYGPGETVYLNSVYSDDPTSPNYSYSKATPNAQLSMCITNPDAVGAFKTGQEYDLMFTATLPVAIAAETEAAATSDK